VWEGALLRTKIMTSAQGHCFQLTLPFWSTQRPTCSPTIDVLFYTPIQKTDNFLQLYKTTDKMRISAVTR
jgi:hypothetical protein